MRLPIIASTIRTKDPAKKREMRYWIYRDVSNCRDSLELGRSAKSRIPGYSPPFFSFSAVFSTGRAGVPSAFT